MASLPAGSVGRMERSDRRTDGGVRRTADHLAVGRYGEDLAASWYEAHGYEVVARNWHCRQGELDIVARRARLVVFCEVKARTSDVFGLPAEAVGPVKQVKLRRLAALWFADGARENAVGARENADGARENGSSRGRGGPVRFDVASVMGGEVEVIEGAF
jgi:putative endonuclease